MWTTQNRVFAQKFLYPDDGVPPAGGTVVPEPATKPQFDDAQQKAINDMLAKERKDAEEKTALRLKQEAEAKAKAESEAREREEATKRGEFDKVRGELETKVASIEQDRNAVVTERDALRTYFDAEYATAVKDLPDVVTAFKPADDAPFAEKSAWLIKAKEQAAKVAVVGTLPGNGPNPRPADGKFDLDAAVATAQHGGKYSL